MGFYSEQQYTNIAGKAPTGYGLGQIAPETTITSVEELDNTKTCGVYRFACQGTTINNITFNYAVVIVSPLQSDGVHQELITMQTGIRLHRDYYDTGWLAWGADNPPFAYGTEYRLTKKYKGYAVYAMLLSAGTLPNKTYKDVSFGSPTEIVDLRVVATSGNWTYTLPLFNDSGAITTYAAGFGSNIRIYSLSTDASAYSGVVYVEYIKD